MDRYTKLHVWMLLPFILAQVSIFYYYWPDFSNNTWEIHIHYWLVSLWYLLVVVQPYLIQTKQIANHRTLGILGFALAGGVIFTGISLMDIPLRIIDNADPNRPGPPVFFFYGLLMAESLQMVAFTIAVVMGVIHRHNVKEHAWWLVASVFYMIAPALGRGMIVLWRSLLPPESFSPPFVFISLELVYLPLLLLYAYKFGKIKHLATLIGVLLVVVRFIARPLGSIEAVQEFLRSLIVY